MNKPLEQKQIPARCTHGADAPGGGGKDPHACKWGQLVELRNGGEGREMGVGGVGWGALRGVKRSVSCAGNVPGTFEVLGTVCRWKRTLFHLLHHSLKVHQCQVSQ